MNFPLLKSDIFIPEVIEKAGIEDVEYDVIPSELQSEDKYTGYGLEEAADLMVEVWVADFVYSTLPPDGTKMTLRGKTYRKIKTLEGSTAQTAKIAMVSMSTRR